MKKINLKSILKKTFKKKQAKKIKKSFKKVKIKKNLIKKVGRPKTIKKDLLNKTSKNKTKVTYAWNGELLGNFPDFGLEKAWITQGTEVLNWLDQALIRQKKS